MLPETLTVPAAAIAAALAARGETIAVAESSAGGLISAALVQVPGASASYRGGVVIYTLEGVQALLAGAVDRDHGGRSASEPFAEWLAASVRARLGTDWALSETGASGPSGNPYGDPPGHAWVGLCGPDGEPSAERVETLDDDRARNMEVFAARALGRLAAVLG